jgi:UrcA family protein
MNSRSNAALAAIAFACLTQIAAPSAAQDRETVSARVLYADLDLSSQAGRATFESRVRRAAMRVCDVDTRDLAAMGDATRCRGEVVASGRRQMAALIANPEMRVASRAPMIVAAK